MDFKRQHQGFQHQRLEITPPQISVEAKNHGGLKRWWSQNVNPSSIPWFVANFAGGHFARGKLRGACRCPASWKRGGEGEPAQVRYGLSQGDWAPWWMVISTGSTCGDKFEFGQRWFQAKHGFSMFQHVSASLKTKTWDSISRWFNQHNKRVEATQKFLRQMMVGFWVANRVFEPLNMPVGSTSVVPMASKFRPLDVTCLPSWSVGSETPSGTGPTRGTCMSETRHLLARATKTIFPSTISSHFQSFPAICKIEEWMKQDKIGNLHATRIQHQGMQALCSTQYLEAAAGAAVGAGTGRGAAAERWTCRGGARRAGVAKSRKSNWGYPLVN